MIILRHPVKILLFVLVVMVTQLASSCDNDAFNSESGVDTSVVIDEFSIEGDGLVTQDQEKISLLNDFFTNTGISTIYSDVNVKFYISAVKLKEDDNPSEFFAENAELFHEEWCGASDRATCELIDAFSCRFDSEIDNSVDPPQTHYKLGCGESTITDVDVTEIIPGPLSYSGYIIANVCNVVCKQSQASVLFTAE